MEQSDGIWEFRGARTYAIKYRRGNLGGMAVPPEWIASILSSVAVLVAIIGWFSVDLLARRRSQREHAYHVKAEQYTSILVSLNRIVLLVSVWEVVRTTDVSNIKQRKANFLKLAGAMTWIPDDEAIDRVEESMSEGSDEKDESPDATRVSREHEGEEETEVEILRAFSDSIDEVTARVFISEAHVLREAAQSLALFNVSEEVQQKLQAVIQVMTERPAQAGTLQIAEAMGLEGLIEMGDFDGWRERASNALRDATNALRVDLERTI